MKNDLNYRKKKQNSFNQDYEKKKKLDKILRSNHRIINNNSDKIRVFVLDESIMDKIKHDDRWREDFDSNEQVSEHNILVEITETYFFYRFILGMIPVEKENLIAYLEPKNVLRKNLKILLIHKIEDQVEFYNFEIDEKIEI